MTRKDKWKPKGRKCSYCFRSHNYVLMMSQSLRCRWCTVWGTANSWDWERNICYPGVKDCTRLNGSFCFTTTECVKRRKLSSLWCHSFATIVLKLTLMHMKQTHTMCRPLVWQGRNIKGLVHLKIILSFAQNCSNPYGFSFIHVSKKVNFWTLLNIIKVNED